MTKRVKAFSGNTIRYVFVRQRKAEDDAMKAAESGTEPEERTMIGYQCHPPKKTARQKIHEIVRILKT